MTSGKIIAERYNCYWPRGFTKKMTRYSALIFAFVGPLTVAAHGNMVWPPTWFDPHGKDGLMPGGVIYGENAPLQWFSNWTFIPEDQEATLDPSLFTVPDFHGDAYKVWDRVSCFLLPPFDYDICRVWYPVDPARNPWMAPGTAPVFSPCGLWGGNPEGCGGVAQDEECPGGGTSMGPDSRDITWNNTVTTPWVRGGVAEVKQHSLYQVHYYHFRLVGAFWLTMVAVTATGYARLARMAPVVSLSNVSNKPPSTLPRTRAGCSLAGTTALGLSSSPTEQERGHSHWARSGR